VQRAGDGCKAEERPPGARVQMAAGAEPEEEGGPGGERQEPKEALEELYPGIPDGPEPDGCSKRVTGGHQESEVESYGNTDSTAAELEEVLPLLEAWPPRPLSQPGRFSLRMRRASTRQAFGICFDAAGFDGRLSEGHPSITAREDYPHLGILKGDTVLSINGYVPITVTECRSILGEAMWIRLVMFRQLPGAPKAPSAHGRSGSSPPRRAARRLLCTSRASVADAESGEFRITIHRTSLSQKFGLCFREAPLSRSWEELAVVVSQNLPHLALRKADRLIEINGVEMPSRPQCESIMEKASCLSLRFQRELPEDGPGLRLRHFLQPMADPGDEASEEEGDKPNDVDEVPPAQPAIEDCTVAACVAMGCADPALQKPPPPQREQGPWLFPSAKYGEEPPRNALGGPDPTSGAGVPVLVARAPACSPPGAAAGKSPTWIFARCTLQDVDCRC